MNYHYEDWLKEKLSFICQDLRIEDLYFDIVSEQDYVKKKDYSPEVVYIVTKRYNATSILSTVIQPMQLVVLSQEYDTEKTFLVLNEFVKKWQLFRDEIKDDSLSYTYIKHDYQTPAIMSNFVEIGTGRRSVIYLPVTLSIMENNLSLVKNITVEIDGEVEEIEPINISLVYNMQGNTQQLPSKNLSETVRSVSISAMNLTLQAISTSKLVQSVIDTTFGLVNGNKTYTFDFGNNRILNMKLSNCQYTDTIEGTPAMAIGFTV